MNTRSFGLLLATFLGGSALIACTTEAADDSAETDDALSAPAANARSCAVHDAYQATTGGEIGPVTAEQFTQMTHIKSVKATDMFGIFDVPGVGKVLLRENTKGFVNFYTTTGGFIAQAHTIADPAVTQNEWEGSNHKPLVCAAATTSSSSGGTSCLATAPIDATQIPYTKSRAAESACTTDELSAITAFYREHATDENLAMLWAGSVSVGCATCAFGANTDATWAPILIERKDTTLTFEVNRGGCVEVASGSEACGRAYEQYQVCTLQACEKKCTTQDEFARCRQDETVLTTSCKDAFVNVKSACGTNLAPAEAACRGNAFTFEGPLRRVCGPQN